MSYENSPRSSSATYASQRSNTWVAVIVLTLVSLLAFANAAHDALVFDDKAFVGAGRISQLDSLPDAFNQDLWGSARQGKGLYRPLLIIEFELETRLFGDWLPGYHLVNIILHTAATLAIFGFLRFLLLYSGQPARLSLLSALLAALVFAVHPVHTEVVNSVFNRSAIYVTLCAVLGLWWLLSRLDTRPASAWLGLGLAYTVGIFLKESALVIPGIAVALIVLLTPGTLLERIRRFLPVFWLLIPIAVYFYLRAMALSSGSPNADTEISEFSQLLQATQLPDQNALFAAFGVFGAGIKLLLWPWPLHLYPTRPSDAMAMVLIVGQLVLAIFAIVLWLRNRPGLAMGLAFYYISMAPSARLISMDGATPHLTERYLYFPSVGLSIILAFAFYALIKRFGTKIVTVAFLPLLVVPALVTWDRNHDWGSQIHLFETEYQRGATSIHQIRILMGALATKGHWERIVEICEENTPLQDEHAIFAKSCANAYVGLNQPSKAIEALERSAKLEHDWLVSRLTIAEVYFAQGMLQEGADQFAYIINRLEDPARKEMYKGLLMLKLYPKSKTKLLEARGYFEQALSLNPDLEKAQYWLDYVNSLLDPEIGNEEPVQPQGT